MSKVAIYARVSTSEQSTDSQLLDLRRYVRERGWHLYREYTDNGVSGTKDSRPALNELMNDAKKRRFDVVLVWRFDRFARSTKHLILALEEFKNLGIDFVSYQENIDTSSPLGSAIFTIISAVAQLERDIIAERVKAVTVQSVDFPLGNLTFRPSQLLPILLRPSQSSLYPLSNNIPLQLSHRTDDGEYG